MPALDPRLFERARPVRRLLAADTALAVLAALLVLAQAVLIAEVIAGAFWGHPVSELMLPIALVAVAAAARGAAMWGFEVVGRRASGSVLSALRLELVERRLQHDPLARDGAVSADLATLAVDGVDSIDVLFARYLPQLVLAVVVPLAVLGIVASIDPLSAAIMLLTLPLVPVFMWLVGRYTERRTNERRDALAMLAGHFADVIRGLPTLRAFNRGEAQQETIERVSDEYRRTTMGTLRVSFLSGAVLELAATLGIALVAVTVGVRLVDAGIGFEAALTVLLLAPELYLPLRNLGAQYHASADGAAVAGRLLDLVEGEERVIGSRIPPAPGAVEIRFEDVSFSFRDREPVLEHASLAIAPGETVALTGASGSGKSTVASLLLGLLEPDGGRVTVGAVDLAAVDPPAWRAHIAWVPQRPTIFRGTVADNIGLGAGAGALPSEAEVRAAAAAAAADGFIAELPDGWETVVGDGGRGLSAGERQRIALARAFLRAAPLLILDEPTANLDPESAARVGEQLERLRGSCSILLITHTAAPATIADRVLSVRSGRILEQQAAIA